MMSGRSRARKILRVDQDERNAAEVIAVQMGQHDRVDRVRIDIARAQRDMGRRAAIDQDGLSRRRKMEAGVEAPAGAERVAGADDR